MNLLKSISENYEGDKSTYIDKEGDEIVSPYSILILSHSDSGFDSWVVFNLVEKWKKKEFKIKTTARGLISLSCQGGVKIVNTI